LQRTAPRIGQHSREVLRELGYDDDRIESLIDSNVVAAG
jgi:crotonobetainyl-CoA:carnitine CoA-transferase CaiB-like acyl-CoA transferase